MFDLEDKRLKSLSSVLTSKASKGILEALSEEDLSEGDISRKINMPANTVNYNISRLMEAGLIEVKESLWSVKGKKVKIYGLSNKQIIISPKKRIINGRLISAFLVTGLIALIIKFFSNKDTFSNTEDSSTMLKVATGSAPEVVSGLNTAINGNPIWVWFLIGGAFGLVVYFLLSNLSFRGKDKNILKVWN